MDYQARHDVRNDPTDLGDHEQLDFMLVPRTHNKISYVISQLNRCLFLFLYHHQLLLRSYFVFFLFSSVHTYFLRQLSAYHSKEVDFIVALRGVCLGV